MCWDYSDCVSCGKRTPCITSCYCDDICSCGAVDCKSHNRCTVCNGDLCSECSYRNKCSSCAKLEHPYWRKCCKKIEIKRTLNRRMETGDIDYINKTMYTCVNKCVKHNVFIWCNWKSVIKCSDRSVRKILGSHFNCKVVVRTMNINDVKTECVLLIRQEDITPEEIYEVVSS